MESFRHPVVWIDECVICALLRHGINLNASGLYEEADVLRSACRRRNQSRFVSRVWITGGDGVAVNLVSKRLQTCEIGDFNVSDYVGVMQDGADSQSRFLTLCFVVVKVLDVKARNCKLPGKG